MPVSARLQNHGCTPLALGSRVEGEATVVLTRHASQQGHAFGWAFTLRGKAIATALRDIAHCPAQALTAVFVTGLFRFAHHCMRMAQPARHP